jgi:hypothetical protein
MKALESRHAPGRLPTTDVAAVPVSVSAAAPLAPRSALKGPPPAPPAGALALHTRPPPALAARGLLSSFVTTTRSAVVASSSALAKAITGGRHAGAFSGGGAAAAAGPPPAPCASTRCAGQAATGGVQRAGTSLTCRPASGPVLLAPAGPAAAAGPSPAAAARLPGGPGASRATGRAPLKSRARCERLPAGSRSEISPSKTRAIPENPGRRAGSACQQARMRLATGAGSQAGTGGRAPCSATRSITSA